jgi:lipopolysaccharide transport system permease protein
MLVSRPRPELGGGVRRGEFSRRAEYLRDLLYELVLRDVRLRYKRSAFGVAWTLLNPIAQLLVLYFVFTTVLPLRIDKFASFTFTALLAWTWFQTSLIYSTLAVVGNGDLVRRSGFPISILPVVTVTVNLVHFLLALPVLALFLIGDGVGPGRAIFALPVVIAVQFVLTLGLAYIVALLHVRFRDTQHLLAIVLQLLFFLTPIFYSPSAVPEQYQALYRINPIVHLVDAYRAILIQGEAPDAEWLTLIGAGSLALLLGAHYMFSRASGRFIEEV